MERHRCKLCHRSFANGRALGGHMKAHLATLPLPPKNPEPASSSSSDPDADDNKSLALAYGLRENPKKSFRLADPEFSFPAADNGSVVIQDRESETESRNPTRRRSKRNRRPNALKRIPSWVVVDSVPLTETEPVSSVSDTSPEEDVAMCLMMLSRDVWEQEEQVIKTVTLKKSMTDDEEDEVIVKRLKRVNNNSNNGVAKHKCDMCKKVFRSHQAMCGHKKICSMNENQEKEGVKDNKIFECPYCYKVFGSGQALGGHKRSHQLNSSSSSATATTTTATTAKPIIIITSTSTTTTTTNTTLTNNSVKHRHHSGLIDLNLPAPLDDDDFSVLSDA
ncbi:hypothetical protein CsatB_004888 [Cannabis sativa]